MEDREIILRSMERLTADIVIAPPISNESVQIANNSVVNSREGKKMIAGHFYPEVRKQLKQLALEKDLSIQALLGEAINDLFIKYGKPPIAD